MRFQVQIDSERCKGCELCVKTCPKALLAMTHAFNSPGFHFAEIKTADACTGCLQCANICPDAAIQIEKHNESQVNSSTRVDDGQ